MKYVVFILLILLSLPSFAQFTVTSGVQLCGKKATLYSLFEGAHPLLHNIPVWKEVPGMSRQAYINKVMKKLDKDLPALAKILRPRIKIVQDHLNIQLIGSYPEFESTTDVVFLEPGCEYKTITMWSEYEILTVDHTIFKLMSPMNQAAFIIQEAMLKVDRDAKSVDKSSSDNDRFWVALMFSDRPIARKKINFEKMTPEEKSTASMPACSRYIGQISPQLNIFVKTVVECKKDRNSAFGVYQQIKSLIQETVSDCQRECFNSEYLKVCNDTGEIVNKPNVCD